MHEGGSEVSQDDRVVDAETQPRGHLDGGNDVLGHGVSSASRFIM
jgi:hypothetical protein